MESSKKYRCYLKKLLLIITYSLLSISIIKSIYKINAVSSVQTVDGIIVPIIMYHQVKDSGLGNDVISPSEFKR